MRFYLVIDIYITSELRLNEVIIRGMLSLENYRVLLETESIPIKSDPSYSFETHTCLTGKDNACALFSFSNCYFKKLFLSGACRILRWRMHLSLAIQHLKVSMLTREVVASNHHLKIVVARATSAKPRFKTRPAGFYPEFLIGTDRSARSVITRALINLQNERAQPSRGPRDDAECHRGHLYTADYEHADSQHDQQTLHRQRTEV